ncbi:MAG TPA: RNA methyltransferase [Sphingobacteriaceae bacterium]|nr:RNA methyltransferase [Sphingobacteriaceae bacterium]
MLSKSQLSLIKSLHFKKFRNQHRLFIVEGHKSITEFLDAKYSLAQLFYIPENISKVAKFPHKMKHYEITSLDFNKISTLKNPNGTLALFEIPNDSGIDGLELKGRYSLVLDYVQDPGNLGTIIRTADWFGIENIICSSDTADCYNPKVVQATMGSLARVSIHYTNLEEWLPRMDMKVYGASLDGTPLYNCDFGGINKDGSAQGAEGLIILGNEGQGIRQQLNPFINEAITIPRFGSAESLNVAIAASLICSEIRRSSFN